MLSLTEVHVRHPLNPASDVYLKRLAPILGLRRLALYVARVPPGKESFAFHRHERCEEFLFILSGRGRAEIGDEMFDVGPGDIMGFPAPDGPPHHLTNPYTEDIVYLMGGESSGLDVAHFPKTSQKLVFTETNIILIDDKASKSLEFSDWLVDSSPRKK
jgi:uncharacterized cupin superfamily protein